MLYGELDSYRGVGWSLCLSTLYINTRLIWYSCLWFRVFDVSFFLFLKCAGISKRIQTTSFTGQITYVEYCIHSSELEGIYQVLS